MESRFFNEIKEIIKLYFPEFEGHDIDSDLRELGLDSLSFVQCIVEIEDYFQIHIPAKYISFEQLGSVRKISSIVESHLQ